MRHFTACLLSACVASVFVSAPVAAQTVYKWKDAKGVTHYSERPPASGKFTARDGQRDPVAATPAKTAAQAPKADPRCASARNNLAALQGTNAVQMDSDEDGKPDRTLSESERTSQMELARSTLKAYNCSDTATGG